MSDKFKKAIEYFDAYNTKDPHLETANGQSQPKELLYALRMTERLSSYAPDADEVLHLAARCQHIGRWEIEREKYPEGKKGYLQWRNEEKMHHASIAQEILISCGYNQETTDKVKFLLLKKELFTNAQTQLLEDVVCLVFIEHYLEEFASRHDDDKVVDILRKTIRKMTPKAVQAVAAIDLSPKMKALIAAAVSMDQQ